MWPRVSFAVLLLAFAVNGQELDPDPEVFMEVPQIISYWGYPSEVHQATTDDGYILTMHRIPYGKTGANAAGSGPRPVIFLQHGLEACSSNFITNIPQYAPGFVLADAGFDVWMGNIRGNLYGKNHTSLAITDHKFWEFSWDEMASHDLDAMINYVLINTKQKSLYYAGHSQGTLIMFSKLSLDPVVFGSKIRQFFALAPIGTVKHIKGALRVLTESYILDELFFDLFGNNEFLPENGIMHTLAQKGCDEVKNEKYCADMIFAICGPESSNLNVSRIPVFLVDEPSGTSSQNVLHWVQIVKSGLQQMYDYGSKKKNEKAYGQDIPPIYDISKIQTDMYLYWSDDDWLADKTDIQEYLLQKLPAQYLKEAVEFKGYNHLDFVWANNAVNDIFIPMINHMKDDLAKRATAGEH